MMPEERKVNPFGTLADIMDPAQRGLDPFPAYRRRRQTAPVSYDPELETWSAFRFADVERVLSEYATFSSRFQDSDRIKRMRQEAGDTELAVDSIITSDPPRHHQLRALVSKVFNPHATAVWAPRITQIANELVDKVAMVGRMDVVRDLAVPLPLTVIAEMLGVSTADLDRFKRWSDELVSVSSTQGFGRPQETESQKEMRAYFRQSIAEHRQSPRGDLITRLIEAEIEGEHLHETDLLNFCVILLVAGNITTTNLIGNATICFDRHPGVMDALRAHPELLPSAIDEVLRYFSPVQAMFRVVATETNLGGQTLRPGQMVMGWIGAANRDETEFPDPERFDIRRDPNRHIALGKGIHYCLGSHLARLEARIALGTMLERLREIRIAPEAQLEPMPSSFLLAARSVPITFRPAGEDAWAPELARPEGQEEEPLSEVGQPA